MRLCVHANSLRLLTQAMASHCSAVRLGSEFCEILLPTGDELEEAVELAQRAGKEFAYVTPRLSNAGIEGVEEQLALLNDGGETHVVFNDLGVLNLLGAYPNLHPHLGRHLLLVPARSPWVEQQVRREDLSSRSRAWIRTLYSSTSLGYRATIELYGSHGCRGADVDWLPRVFPSLAFLVENGLHLSVHLHLVPATLTRKCHTARFLGEEDPESCSQPCLDRAFLLRNEAFGLELYLHGNAAFRLVEPDAEGVAALEQAGVSELVLTMNPVTGIDSTEKIDSTLTELGLGG
jgi:hypothetical protein